jgi:hypothetical protein
MTSCGPSPSRTFYPNGKLKSVYTIEKGKMHGAYVEYYQNGFLKEERTYVYGELTGLFKQYHDDGSISTETEYLQDFKNGLSIAYHYNGKQFTTSHYKNGVKVGEEFEYDSSGTCTERVLFDSTGNLLFHQRLSPEKYSRVHPIVRVDAYTVEIGKNCKVVVSFGYDLHGEVSFKFESLDHMTSPITKVDADTAQDHYRLNLRFKEAGVHNVRVTILHRQRSGDTLTADGITKDLQVTISDAHASDI